MMMRKKMLAQRKAQQNQQPQQPINETAIQKY
jgi:hypothetical protein